MNGKRTTPPGPSAADLAATVREFIGQWPDGTVGAAVREAPLAALDALVARCEAGEKHAMMYAQSADRMQLRAEQAERERDDYRFWNERVRTCENHTSDVIDGDCLVCALQSAEARVAELDAALRQIEYAATREMVNSTLIARIAHSALATAPADTEGGAA